MESREKMKKSVKNILKRVGKDFINKVSGCNYCPLKESCDLRKDIKLKKNKEKL